MKLFLLTALILGICVFGMCFNIIFRKDGEFPDSEIGHSKAMRERGITCAKVEEKRLWGKNGLLRRKGGCTKEELKSAGIPAGCGSCNQADCAVKEIMKEERCQF